MRQHLRRRYRRKYMGSLLVPVTSGSTDIGAGAEEGIPGFRAAGNVRRTPARIGNSLGGNTTATATGFIKAAGDKPLHQVPDVAGAEPMHGYRIERL